jgi:ribosome-binding protein aMBF1 (putative translation factor)
MHSCTLLSIAFNALKLLTQQRDTVLADVMVQFGRRLRKARQERGVSQERLAELAGLHRTYVSSVERGERNISLLNIEKLAAALGVAMSDLMP